MLFNNYRQPEPEVMTSLDEVLAYDRLTLKYLKIIHHGFIETVINASPESGWFLEIGCGTARISLGIAGYTRDIRFTAVDKSPTMLAAAKKIAAGQGMAHRVCFEMADARALPFADAAFDAVFCHNMLHHLEDPVPVLREMKRVVRPDGAFLVRDLIRQPRFMALAHAWGFGLSYSRLMRSEYYASMRAAFSKDEFLEMMQHLRLSGCRYTRQFITHHGLERPAAGRRRSQVSVLSPIWASWLKHQYST